MSIAWDKRTITSVAPLESEDALMSELETPGVVPRALDHDHGDLASLPTACGKQQTLVREMKLAMPRPVDPGSGIASVFEAVAVAIVSVYG